MELNKIQSSGSWGKAADDLNQNFSKVNNAVEQVKNATTRNKGYFSTDAALKSAFKSASLGDIAYIGRAYPYQTWEWDGSEWTKKNDNGGDESVNLGDYYTKEETDKKLSDTSEEISGLRTETDKKLSDTSEEISGLRTETDAKLSELGSEVDNITKYDNSDSDLNISDEEGNVIAEFKDGHIKTKYFDSSNLFVNHSDLDVVIFGDSITWLGGDDCDGSRVGYEHRGWTEYFKEKFKPKSCKSYARSGATWSNTENTKYNVTEYSGSLTDDNVMYNQVNRLEVAINNGTQPIPNLILVAMGTNDAWHKSDTSLEMSAETAFANLNGYITDSDITTITNVANAVRFNCEKLMQLCPNAQIILIAPQQSSAIPQTTMRKCCTIIEDCAGWMGLNCIRLDKVGGTYYAREKTSYHKTYDGTHTSVIGATENGYYIANIVSNILKY